MHHSAMQEGEQNYIKNRRQVDKLRKENVSIMMVIGHVSQFQKRSLVHRWDNILHNTASLLKGNIIVGNLLRW